MHWIPLVIMAGFALLNLAYWLALVLRPDPSALRRDLKVSILLAARDEEQALPDALRALAALDYPTSKLEILVGDDHSSDGTAALVEAFAEAHQQFRLVPIRSSWPGLRGKHNVLAQLAAQATGEVLLFTDADIRVDPRWAAAMVAAVAEGGMATGPTVVDGKGWFARVQGLDWLMGQALARAHTSMGIPITAVGNNMAIHRSAYEAVGGYEQVPFSVTEDYALFQQVVERQGLPFANRFHPEAGALSLPLPDWAAWKRQRKRWFTGGLDLAWYNRALIFFNALIVPALVLGLAVLPATQAWALVALKVLADLALVSTSARKLGKTHLLRWFLPYEVYYWTVTIVTPVLLILPGKVVWKGRQY